MSSSNHPNTETDDDSSDPILEWQDEAKAIIKDVQNHVKEIQVSTKFESDKANIFLNLTTLEEETFCVRISTEGFQIVGRVYDTVESNGNPSVTYETPYALLNDISALYVESFGNDLTAALQKIIEHKWKTEAVLFIKVIQRKIC